MSACSLITRRTCRVCDSPLTPILSLGDQQIAGAFASPIKRTVPLDLMRCDTQATHDACGLVQLRHTVPGAVLYNDYGYRSGINQTMTDNLHGIARQAEEMARLCAGDLVVDIGCNDGTLLDGYRTGGLQHVGFDPCDVAAAAEAKGYAIVRDFFSAADMPVYPASVITSIAMFYDLDDPVGFAQQVAGLLADDGVWAVELHYLPAMLAANSFDAIVHEHLGYYSLSVLERVVDACGLEVVTAETNAINGGSIRLFVGHRGARPVDRERLRALRVAEFELGLDSPDPYSEFAHRVADVRDELREVCALATAAGKRIHVYGASTKGNTILQYARLGPDVIECAADRNPEKWGTVTATGIPIVSEDESRARRPDYYLALPWHFLNEFLEREREFVDRGGRFVVPLPTVRTVPE